MKLLRSLISAFSMYSAIPMPTVEWKEENRRYALCFFPLVGTAVGLVFFLWTLLCRRLEVGELLRGAVSALIPLFITGGIHFDGFCDVTDAKASCGDIPKKLEIMSDPHIGSFAAVNACAYLILQTALFCEIKTLSAAGAVACGYAASRSLSGIAAVSFKCAKKEGTLQSFVKPAHKKITAAVLLIFTAVSFAAMAAFSPAAGGLAALAAASVTVYYKGFSYKSFGGITGDTEGWFLQICELSMLAAVAAGEGLTEAFL